MMKRLTGCFSIPLLVNALVLVMLLGCRPHPAETATTRAPTTMAPTVVAGQATEVTTPTPGDATSSLAVVIAETPVRATTLASPTTPALPTETPSLPTPLPSPTPTAPPHYTYNVIASYPHDPDAFTQGLDIDDGMMYEGTGLHGRSSLRLVNLETGAVLQAEPLAEQYFGEGITVLGDRIFQLTWQEHTGFVYDQSTFELIQTFNYPHEGWGITHDGDRLIVSDGTSTIRFWDPETLEETGHINVSDNEGPVVQLNELEYINGEIWANVWLTDRIARISPETGQVVGWIDLTGLLDTSDPEQPADVLNGIAYDEANDRLFATGKLWPTLYEIEVISGE